MTIDYLAVAAGKYRNFESELADAAAHAIHGGVVLARVARILDESFERPSLDVLRGWG